MKEDCQHADDQRRCDSSSDTCCGKEAVRRNALLEAKSSLINSTVYHVRTLSNAVIGFSELLLSEPLNGDASEYAREIHNAGQGLSSLATEILDWTQLLSGTLQIVKTKFSLSEILDEIRNLLSCSASQKGLEYEIVIDPQTPAFINSDQDRLLTCLVNLTVSAIKHTQQGSVRIHVMPEQFDKETFIRFDVIDTGIGLAPEKLDEIFDSAVYRIEMDEHYLPQLDRGISVTTGSPLTKQLCVLLGGTLTAKSRENEGSTFTLHIPAGVDVAATPKIDLTAPNETIETEETDPVDDMTDKTILLVEDQQSNRTVIGLMLESLGVQVDCAEDGEEAVGKCAKRTYGLILMDLKMPKMDGYEATRQLRQQGIESPIVALSATVLDNQEPQLILEHFDGFLTKPVDIEKLSAALSNFLKSRPAFQGASPEMSHGENVDDYKITTIDYTG